MAYISPETVLAPRNRVGSVDVLYDGGPGGWSAALLEYDGRPERVAIRWNGREEESGIGNPQSRGKPTWFVVPDELATVVREEVERLSNSRHGRLVAGYREMENDQDREAQAREWCEGLIGDGTHQER